MKGAFTGLFAASLMAMTDTGHAASLVDVAIASARSHLSMHDCQLPRGAASCKKHRASARQRYETASVRSTTVDENPIANAARSASPVGQWIVDADDRRVQIVSCGKSLCGVISAAKPDAVDRFNPDPDQRGRSIVNLPVLIEMTQTDINRWEGPIYNTRDGRTYSGRISLRNGNLLEVEGNAPHALLLQTWIKDTSDLH